ncbi:putative carbon-carbon lyase [Escherichia coli]|uniref:Putative carbon-carbon lyase n=1 Tax=Escherichia coli TaxID=562 RepID=A0A376SAS6_ECOLX|nr:putative carbon-carbon lyase [Escherichia coli]
MVDTADQARQVVSATRYPPYGERGVGASVARAARWGRIENYMAQVNDSLCLLVQVKVKQHWITWTKSSTSKGLTACLLDLRIFLPRWATRITPGTRKCSELLKPAFGGSVLRVKRLVFWLWLLIWAQQCLAWGANFVAVGVDTMLYSDALDQRLAMFKSGKNGPRIKGNY